ncbi:MATE family efflux transporter [[Eubacterium] hominis]|uniref:MATE family efflux transporter n=1 Tax=[Eubacterium] hominis TaxID=2764325 RepID=UPI003A4D2B50
MVQDMTKGTPWKLILSFSIPLLIGNIFQQLYSMVDTIIVGRFVSVEALAAVGSTGSMSFLILGFVMGITSGFSVITAQRFGANDEAGVRRSVAMSMELCIIATVLLTIIAVLGAKPMLHLMNTPANIFEDASIYITIIYAGLFASVYYNMVSSISRALGDSKTPLYFLLVSSILNVILDLLFIISFQMGASGAAIATVISQFVSAVLCTIYMAKRYTILKLKKEDFRFDWLFACSHLNIGLPMAFQFSVTAVGIMVLQSALNAFGSTAIAAYTAASKVEMLVTQPFATLGVTMATYCGQNKGANDFQRIHKGMTSCVVMCMVACVIASLINIMGGHAFTQLFMSEADPDVFQYSQQYLTTIAVFYPALGLLYIYRNGLQGMGESLVPMLGGVVEFIARLVVCLWLPSMLGYTAICMASPAAWVATTVLLLWKYVQVVKVEKKKLTVCIS